MKKYFPILLALILLSVMVIPAAAYDNEVTFTGQGLIADGFGAYDLDTELCGVENGADAEGPYLLWVLTATQAKNADITGPWGESVAMTKEGNNGTFKYISEWFDPEDLVAFPVTATYDGEATNVQLVISHGCRPFKQGAWCSPGFWKNAEEAAWDLTGYSRTDLFNSTVFDEWYGATFSEDPTLDTVLTTGGGTYKGAPVAGTKGYALNAFNAVGAFLTDQIPGYKFDWDVMQEGSSDACPLDHHGSLAKVFYLQTQLRALPVHISMPLIINQ